MMGKTEIEQSNSAQVCASVSIESLEPMQENSRRRLFKAGMATAPIVLTLTSRPALAACRTTSLVASANLSNPTKGTLDTSGVRTQALWISNSNDFPSPLTKNTNFDSAVVDGVNVFSSSTLYKKTASSSSVANLLDVINGTARTAGDTAPTQFHKNLVVALLNIQKVANAKSCLSALQLSQMFLGTFKPSNSAAPWSQDQITTYLTTNSFLG